MRLSIDHRTVYRFTAPQSRLVQMLRLSPENTYDQTVASWRIDVDHDARMRHGRDGFGNAVTMLYVEGPLDALEIAVTGEVLTSHSDGVLHDTHEPLPPALFLRSTPATVAGEGLGRFVAQVADGRSRLSALHAVNRALHARFPVERSRPVPGRSAAEAFEQPSATPRDLAHMFVAAARLIGAPARYVSGYCATLFEGSHRPTPHGWAEAHVEGIGWIGFDPSFGVSPEDAYVRVAAALDANGAAAVAGSRLGEGDEVLDVDVSVVVDE